MKEITKITSNKIWIKDSQNINEVAIENYDKCSLKYVHKIDCSIAIVEHSFNYNEIVHYIVTIDKKRYLIKKTDLESSYDLSND